MSTTRHLVNRQRRLATAAADRTAAPAPPKESGEINTPDPEADANDKKPARHEAEGRAEAEPEPRPGRRPPRLRTVLPALLCALTVLLGAFAAWAFTSAGSLRDDPSRQNTALTDIGRTSEVKGQITEAVGAVFSYDYASPAKSDRAASTYLVGKAVGQHKDMLAEVRAQAPKQKLVLTTTVTESGVELLDGDRARLLIFADQSNTRTGKAEETTYAAAMFAVDAVRRGDTWRIAAIDTFTR
ncbi:hypothetical protein OG413_33195 [Streptomyces sp. NBC_01433]|uniref:hypothetical protein n=1 Tax=Streptomyces sp. NBC_01433 TaxID=2903864 RepID=UPI00225695E6|nr:hypothetical protein [Streptomyces sp. NBC_01433]MCX4680076.1 hypothetical protein [Streptomyces sp. NBC_01433]